MNKESNKNKKKSADEELETREWIESLDYVLENKGEERAAKLIKLLQIHAQKKGVKS